MGVVGKFIEMMNSRYRRRAVRRALDSLRRNLASLTEPGCNVDLIGLQIYQDVARIELYSGPDGEMIGPSIWL